MKKSILFIITIFLGCSAFAQDPDPRIFQTWYLYSDQGDLGDIIYYVGEDVPRITIFSDFSFEATDNCWFATGNFEYTEENIHFVFGLNTLNYSKECIFGGSSDYLLGLIYDFTGTLDCEIFETMGTTYLFVETIPGFEHYFKNEITLGINEQVISEIAILPNPASNAIQVINSPIPIQNVQVFNINGNLINNTEISNDNAIDISQLVSGMYFLQLRTANTQIVKRFIKQ